MPKNYYADYQANKINNANFFHFLFGTIIFSLPLSKQKLKDMTNKQIINHLRIQLSMRNKRPRIASTAYPDFRLPFNQWAVYIRREALK